jgi:kumamolisin
MGRSHEWTLTPPEVGEWYAFPPGLDGTGQSIALIELAGGCRVDDLGACYDHHGVRMPAIAFISVDGAKNDPTPHLSSYLQGEPWTSG